MHPVNLTNCDHEPIHLPGSIQAHGFLLGLEATNPDLPVALASQNAGHFLLRPLADILGHPLAQVLPPATASTLRNALSTEAVDESLGRFVGTFQLSAGPAATREFQAVAHRRDNLVIVEFELVESPISQAELNAVIADFAVSLEKSPDAEALCHVVAAEVRRLSRFDRVLLYRFDNDGHGTVIAEDRNDRLPSYLGLRFPGSDIPRQARALYILNRLRIIPDVDYQPSPLVMAPRTALAPGPGDPESIDLSLSTLRSVSPVHRDYMRNMGTAASMSISIVTEGRLWGLISAHNSTPRTVPYLVRSACDVISRILTTQLVAFENAASMAHAIRLKSVHGQLLTYMASGENYIDGLVRHPGELLAVAGARGAAILVGDRCVLLGETPGEAAARHIARWVANREKEEVFATGQLSGDFPPAEEFRAEASGLLAISLSQVHRMQLLWFRPEVIETVHWAGEPVKHAAVGKGGLEIHPRNSFATWKEIVRGHSEPWSPVEIDSAREFRQAVLEIVLKRAEELADMAAELEYSNKELEAFSYSVSHDLRAPFRHISGFAELLLQNEADRLSSTGKRHLTTIAKSAQFAGLLVDSLLNFSQISRSRLDLRPVPMKLLVEEVWRDVRREELKGRDVSFTVGDLPTVHADINLLRQVWRNLLSNAAKYTRRREHAEVVVRAETQGDEYIFSVRDNGVGFDGAYAHKLFGAFQRLHRMEDFEGTGIGLANIRRIIARHNGRTWAEGEENKGACFFFTLPASLEPRDSSNPKRIPAPAAPLH